MPKQHVPGPLRCLEAIKSIPIPTDRIYTKAVAPSQRLTLTNHLDRRLRRLQTTSMRTQRIGSSILENIRCRQLSNESLEGLDWFLTQISIAEVHLGSNGSFMSPKYMGIIISQSSPLNASCSACCCHSSICSRSGIFCLRNIVFSYSQNA